MKSSRASAGKGVVPSPPAMYTLKPCSTLPSSNVRVVAITPASLNMACPQSVSQPEKLILNLRGRRWARGLRTKCLYAASAQGLMSSTSNGHAPARWQPCTLRTVSPHASRVVRPTDASCHITSGMSDSSTKWNWMFCRVVMWPHPRLWLSTTEPSRSSWSAVMAP